MKKFLERITPGFILSWYHLAVAALAAFCYGFPSRKMIVVGVTGTNGKSTTVNLIGKILEEAGYKIGLTSSVNFKIGEKEWMNKTGMTMVGRFGLQKMLRQMADAKCEYAVLEVSSEGIKQWRHWGVDFDVAVFTNLEPEHIESHGGFENYKKAKGKLFASLAKSKKKKGAKKVSVINLNDKEAGYFLSFWAEEKYGYQIKNQISNIKNTNQELKIIEAENIKINSTGIDFNTHNIDFNLKLLGEFNVYNALAAICAGLSQGIDLEICKRALEKVRGIPGRMEIIVKEPFKVVVDYAHTPEALQKVYQTLANLRESITNSANMICVLGSDGGVRDKWKRPKLGEIAAKYCDKIILTDVNPFDEKPEQILSDIKSGIKNYPDENLFSIVDRRKAINKALTLVEKGDTVIITGKGCEQWLKGPGGSMIPWDDREVVREEIIKMNC